MAESGDRQAWSEIDEIERGGYPYLEADDLCYYYLERSHGTWEKGMANSTVSNFQKDVERYHDRPDVLRYKQKAIEYFADKIGRLFARKQRTCPLVIVPMITSKPKTIPGSIVASSKRQTSLRTTGLTKWLFATSSTSMRSYPSQSSEETAVLMKSKNTFLSLHRLIRRQNWSFFSTT